MFDIDLHTYYMTFCWITIAFCFGAFTFKYFTAQVITGMIGAAVCVIYYKYNGHTIATYFTSWAWYGYGMLLTWVLIVFSTKEGIIGLSLPIIWKKFK